MSAHVGSARFESRVVENVGVAVGIASPALSIQKLFPLFLLPVFYRHFEFGKNW